MDPSWESTDLEGVWSVVWRELEKAARTPGNAWRTPVLATAGDSGGGRVVVLRQSVEDSRELTFHTDLRSPKVSALRTSPWVTWVFYEPRTQVQLRVRAAATIHAGDSVAAEAWERVPAGSRKNYSTVEAPGTERPHPMAGEYLEKTGVERFAVVRTVASSVDWLWLAEGGHRRARWEWNGAIWVGRWLTP
jgi:hypothetical protein